jgi:hypothetical protein
VGRPNFPECPTCQRTALTWYECLGCKEFGCQRCWDAAQKCCPRCEHEEKRLVPQKFDIGESRLTVWLTFNKHGEYIPYLMLDRLVGLIGLVDKPVVKASAALLVGACSFVAVALDKTWLKMTAAGLGMVLPSIYLACQLLKKPVARWLSRALDFRGGSLARLHSEGHFRVPLEDLEPQQRSDAKRGSLTSPP